ncbi:MAG: hypothetical protein ACE15C_11230 [Phycisphaerae bacterium]
MKKAALLALMTAALCGAAAGDTVYMRDGRNIEGKATKKDGKVRIEMAAGTIEVDEKDVIYIATGPVSSAPAATPAPTAGAGPASAPAPGAIAGLDAAQRPETVVFSLMRQLAVTAPGTTSFELRQQIETWRAAVHDRKRKPGPEWVLPRDYIRRRNAFDETNKEATDLFRKGKTNITSRRMPPAEALAPAFAKFRQAAASVQDPMIRGFLLAVADYESGNYLQAAGAFKQLRTDAPAVPAFWQGEAMSLMDLDRGTEALTAAVEVLRLRPDSMDALTLVRKAMQKVPGTDTKVPVYLAAKDLVAAYTDPSPAANPANRTTNWLMPGKPWISRDDQMPAPTADRYDFRQGVAVPVAANMLLVDSAVTADAIDIYVRVNDKTLVPATLKKITTTIKTPLPPLAMLVVQDCTFTALAHDRPPDASTDDRPATIYGLGIFKEMGQDVRAVAGKARFQTEGPVKVGGSIAPGEGAAPVITEDGSLMCFLTAKADPNADNGGEDAVIDLPAINALIKAAKSGSTYSPSGRLKRNITPQAAAGRTFVVVAVSQEKFEEK